MRLTSTLFKQPIFWCSVLLLSSGSWTQIASDSLKAEYLFNGDLTDNSLNNNTVTAFSGTFVSDRFQHPNSAFHLNGTTDSLVFPISSFTPIVGDFSISFWYKTSSSKLQNLISIKNNSADTVHNFDLQINSHNQVSLQNNKQIWYQTYAFWNGTGVSNNAIAEGGAGPFTKGEWCHFVLERSADTFRIFRNNSLTTLSIDQLFGDTLGSVSQLVFGASPFPFKGDIDDFRFYKRCIDPTEVFKLYMENKPFAFTSPQKTDAFVQGSTVLVNWDYNLDLISDSIQVEFRINSGPWQPSIHSHHYYENYTYLDMNQPIGTTLEVRVSDFSDSTISCQTGPIEVSPYQFIEVAPTLPFTNRDGAGLLNFKGKMWLLGGWDPPHHPPNSTMSEVWNSTDGINWEQQPDAPWPPRHCSAWLVKDSAIWVIGGDPQSGCLRDVWKSEDGLSWTQVLDTIPNFAKRNNLNYGVLNNKLLIYGGEECGIGGKNDVWESQDGMNWNQLPDAPWEGRGMQINYCVDNQNNLWMLGGSNESDRRSYNDVWKTNDGINWIEVLTAAPWNGKHWHTTAFFDNKIWVIAGMNTAYESNDFWYSENGLDWKQLKSTLGNVPSGTRHAQSTTVYNNALWYMCGIASNNAWKIVNSSQMNDLEEFENTIQCFPNPSTGVINIHSKLYIQQLEVFSISGEKIPFNYHGNSLEISAPSGMYLLNIVTKEGAYKTPIYLTH